MRAISFFGHRDFEETIELAEKIKNNIIDAILDFNIDTLYFGGYGNFDKCCLKYAQEIKTRFPHIKLIYVYAYLKENQKSIDKRYYKDNFDDTVYPPIEKVPLKFAIIKRNEWIINKSTLIFFYESFSFGGTYKAYKYAIKKNKLFINFGKKGDLMQNMS